MVALKFVQYILAFSSAPLIVSGAVAPLEKRWPLEIVESIHSPSWPEFISTTTRWSNYHAPTFDWAFVPKSEKELSVGLNFFSRKNMTWLAKSGGHGYSATLGSVRDTIMINMKGFKYAKMNPDNTVTVGSGATFQDVADAVGAAGRELTIGSCPCVGATGAMLGGGIGRLQGKHGLTSDAVRKVRMVLWDGTVVEASEKSHQGLFWGVRGGGQNFGIVIETTLETFPQSNGGLHYMADMQFDGESLESIIDIINGLFPVDPALSLVIIIAVDPESFKPLVAMNLVYAGAKEDGEKYTRMFAPFSISRNETVIPWAQLGYAAAGGAVAIKCETGQSHSMYGSVVKTLDAPTFRRFFDSFSSFVDTNRALVNSTILLEVFGLDGIERRPASFSAFPHRETFNNLVEIEMAYTDNTIADAADDWARGWRDTMSSPDVSGYEQMVQYQNYAHGDEPLSALYGYAKWRHALLTGLKRRYDPHGFFNGYHAVPADLAGWS
ncbi:hypothetical protein D8B26_004003 [Coccidioides posadasii str. Silveira]|uniref:FAD linked oxidase N-terminal domain-containing protein n=1 Tax=Coccidioides posadasii (strain RMSCC 757 / Silveira) TaxID=443226 RepID=E9DJZ5_COCPS|nr:hypothetical protein CPSG_10144 [Coccidioides posadasii str. Silveira]QVM09340.1 hypothetical protein D8B26_004003 [Coccidioides posadasii str. Silveira]